MADAVTTAGRPKGDSQGHAHEQRGRGYNVVSGGTVQSIDHPDAPPGKGTRGYSAREGGGAISKTSP